MYGLCIKIKKIIAKITSRNFAGVASMHSAFALRTIKAFEGYPVSAAQIGDPAR